MASDSFSHGFFSFPTYTRYKFFFLMFIYLFILKEKECVCKQGRVREKGRKRIPSKLCAVSAEPDMALALTNREIMT